MKNSKTSIDIQQSATGFQIAYKGRPILRHSSDQPCIRLGRGRGQYKMRHGSFKIREKRPNSFALESFSIEQSAWDQAKVTFASHLEMLLQVTGARLEIDFVVSDPAINRFWIDLVAEAGEHIYGCGEQYTHLDLKGRKVPLWVEEQGIGRGKDLITFLANLSGGAGGDWYTTYFAQPTFVSSKNYWVHLETRCYAQFDFGNKKQHRLVVWGVPEKLVFDTAPSAVQIFDSLTAYLGRQPALPDWVFDGMWLATQGGEQALRDKLRQATQAGVQVSAVWAQDWVGEKKTLFGTNLMWDWQYNQRLYPDLPDLIRDLSAQGIRFLGYINSFLDTKGELYQEAKDKGYLVRKQSGEVYLIEVITFPVGILDLTNPEARTWIKSIIKERLLGIGLAGWMADFGEHVPADAKLFSGESAEQYHNRYPVVWAQVNYEAILEANCADRVIFFTRSGHIGSSRYSPLFWAGDQLVNWSLDDGLATIIPAGLSLGFTGVGAFHADIGGYTTVGWIKRSKELFLRWVEAAAFSPIMRSHEGLRPAANWQFNTDEQTLQHLAHMTNIYKSLGEYLRYTALEYQTQGLPFMRHPYIHYEDEPILHTQKYQYLLGRDLLVAPVYLPKRTRWRVILPDDRWVHLWSAKVYAQGIHSIEAPLGQPPVFYRQNSKFADLFRSLNKGNHTPDPS